MKCSKCGADLEHRGQGHRCTAGPDPVVQLPVPWQVASWIVLVLTLLFAAHSLLRAAISAELVTAPAGLPVTGLSIGLPLALFVAYLVWLNLTKTTVERHGGVMSVVRNWAMSLAVLFLVASYLLPMKTPTVFHVGRAAAAILFAAGLVISRAKLRRWLAGPVLPADPVLPAGSAGDAPGLDEPRPGSLPQPPRSRPPIEPPVGRLPPTAEVRSQDWDASLWDPEIHADIERRRRSGGGSARL